MDVADIQLKAVKTMACFAVIRDLGLLGCDCEAISELFAITLRQNSGLEAERLLGVWIQPDPEIPLSMENQLSPMSRSLSFARTCGIEDRWMVHWPMEEISRIRLFLYFLDQFPHAGAGHARSGYFMPFFPLDIPPPQLEREFARLNRLDSKRLIAPGYQDPASGRLYPIGSVLH